MNARSLTALLVALDAGVLLGVRPHPAELLRRLHTPRAWLEQSPDAALASVSGTLLWLVAAWLCVGIVATLLARLPGALGYACSAVSRRLLPGAVRRIVAGSIGLGVLLAPVPVAVGTSVAAAAQPTAVTALPTPVWPGVGVPSRPSAPEPPSAPSVTGRDPREPVVVRPGDSLWLIAARRLGPHAPPADVAAAWPRWYAANRHRIGDDPGLIRPGQRLTPPDPSVRP